MSLHCWLEMCFIPHNVSRKTHTHTHTCTNTPHTRSFRLQTPLDNVFDISDSSSRSQTRCLWHILALLYPHPLRRASKWDTSAGSKNHRPSPQTERFVLRRRNGKTDRRGKYQKYCLHLASFQNVDSCKTDVVNLILFFSFTVCKRTALGFSLFKAKYNNPFNGKHWLWASIKNEACHKCGFMEMNGAFLIQFIVHLPEMQRVGGETSPRITAIITYLLHGHACQFRVQSFAWRHNGWKTQITCKCGCERFWNCSLWYFLFIYLFPNRAWTAQVPSCPFHCAAAGHQPGATASPRAAFHVALVLQFFSCC